MFTPPEIPLSGYTPPQTNVYSPPEQNAPFYPQHNESFYQPSPPSNQPSRQFYSSPATAPAPSAYATDSSSKYAPNQVPTYKPLHTSQVYSQQPLTPNLTPKPFTPSPIATEKLAVFEPEIQYNPPVIRRPLTIPNQVVRNVSPTPFGPRYTASSGHHATSAVNIPAPKSPYGDNSKYNEQTASWSSYDSKRNATQSNRLSSCSYSSSTNYTAQPQPPPRNSRISMDLSQAENYNRAARGWGASKDYYRPLSFAKPVELPYSDF